METTIESAKVSRLFELSSAFALLICNFDLLMHTLRKYTFVQHIEISMNIREETFLLQNFHLVSYILIKYKLSRLPSFSTIFFLGRKVNHLIILKVSVFACNAEQKLFIGSVVGSVEGVMLPRQIQTDRDMQRQIDRDMQR